MEESRLASELARMQNMVRELGEDRDLPPAAREICGELASRVDRSLRMARSWLPAGPDSPGSSPPRGDGTAGNAAAQFKRRKGVPSVRKQVRATSLADTTAALDDGFSWRKYGQKDILGAKYPRSYFRCTHRHTRSCLATKQVQRADADPLLFGVVYHGAHTCVAHSGVLEQQPGHAGRDQTTMMTSLLATGPTGGDLLRQAGFEPTTPSLSATPGGGYPPLLSPASSDWQTRSSSHAAGGGLELLEHQFQEFFSNSPDSFQWDFFQDIYAAN